MNRVIDANVAASSMKIFNIAGLPRTQAPDFQISVSAIVPVGNCGFQKIGSGSVNIWLKVSTKARRSARPTAIGKRYAMGGPCMVGLFLPGHSLSKVQSVDQRMRLGMRCRLSPNADLLSHTSGAAMGHIRAHAAQQTRSVIRSLRQRGRVARAARSCQSLWPSSG
jgi:hypothetical protein